VGGIFHILIAELILTTLISGTVVQQPLFYRYFSLARALLTRRLISSWSNLQNSSQLMVNSVLLMSLGYIKLASKDLRSGTLRD
jgi:hypothetical protein